MKRAWIAGVYFAATAIPVLVMSVLLFGCCVLPFHRVIHRLFPYCGGIVKLLTPESHHDAVPAKAASKKTATPIVFALRQPGFDMPVAPFPRTLSARARQHMAHGALRCDQDVGLHLLISVLLI